MSMYTKWAVRAPLRSGWRLEDLAEALGRCERGALVFENVEMDGDVLVGSGEFKDYDRETTVLLTWVTQHLDRNRMLIGEPWFVRWYEADQFPEIITT